MIIERFEKVAAVYRDKIAIKDGEKTLTYHQLNCFANRIGGAICSLYHAPDLEERTQTVALLFEHGVDFVAVLLAVLKAGKTFVPFDSTYPQKRLEYMCEFFDIRMIVTNSSHVELAQRLAAAAAREIVVLNIDTPDRQEHFEDADLNIETKEDSLTYIMMTSGSSGEPKGVMQSCKNACFFAEIYIKQLNISPGDRITFLSAINHDGMFQDVFAAFLSGAALYPYNVRKQGITGMDTWMSKEQITFYHSVPTVFRYFTGALSGEERFPYLRTICMGGEPLRTSDIQIMRRFFPNVRLAHMYGQAESSVNTMGFIDTEKEVETVTIGTPLEGITLLLINEEGEEAEELEEGEIFVASPYVSPGYWKNPEATAISFFQDEELGKIYKTGDWGRLGLDGRIEFIARVDNQVKIRGFRVEPGEIESWLLKWETVKIEDAVVTGREKDGENHLCAYIVSKEVEKVPVTGLKNYLSKYLPGYMIPLYIVQVARMPRTESGKVNKRLLPDPGISEDTSHFEAPRNNMERKMAELWWDVLGIKEREPDINANFFDLGGHSLKATILISKIHQEFDIKIPLAAIFEFPTVKQFCQHVTPTAARYNHTSIEPVEKREYYALSSAQKRLYVLRHLEVESIAYNMPQVIPLPEETDINQLEKTFQQLIRRHESLRTSFHMIEGTPVQRIHHHVEFRMEYDEPTCSTREFTGNFVRPFDLGQAPLLRVALISTETGEQLLVIDMHHIIADGMSRRVVEGDFKALYKGKELPPLKIQYKDFSQWQNSEQEKENRKKQGEYWLKQFEGEIPILNIPTDFPRPSVQSFEGAIVNFEISADETSSLKAMALAQGTTLFMVLLAVMDLLFAKLSSQEDVVIGTPILGRRHADLERTMGMFVNTLALRNYPRGEKSFIEFLNDVKKRTLEAFENQEYQFEDLVEIVEVTRDAARNPLFDVMMLLYNIDIEIDRDDSNAIAAQEYHYEDYEHYEGTTAKFDLTLVLTGSSGSGKLLGSLNYCTRLFKPQTIESFIGYFKSIVSQVCENTQLLLSDIEIMSPGEKTQLLVDFNGSEAVYPHDKTIHQLFEEQAEKTPLRTALIGQIPNSPIVCITYQELNRKSNQLAYLLRDKGVKPDTIVAIMVERSIEMVIDILGILKAGGAYLPIDPDYPEERIKYMLKDSGAKILVTDPGLSGKIEKLSIVNCQLSMDEDTSPAAVFSNPQLATRNSQLVYVLYTSGSTGNPKGVTIEHGSVVNIISYLFKEYPLFENDTYLFKTSYVFDVSVSEIFEWFLGGGRLAILEPGAEKDPEKIVEAIHNMTVTHINFVPSMFNVFVDSLTPGNIDRLASLKYIFLAGEALLPLIVNKFRKLDSKILLENIFGPTEATIYASKYSLSDWNGVDSISIGKPLQNMRVYIINKYARLQPVGVVGELCIAGIGLARGYLNNPELTIEKFIELEVKVEEGEDPREQISNSNSQIPNKHMSYMSQTSYIYKTGDLAKWLPDGNIVFLGRIDHQVKIRGFRIELGEIENQLLKFPGLREAVVVVKANETGDKYLCAYIVPDIELAVSELQEYLARDLPGYMIPAFFVTLKKIPLTPSGKIDRKALPAPEVKISADTIAPRNAVEEKLAGLWSEVLGIENHLIGIDSNFFRLGGHSLKATVLTDKMHKTFDVKVPLKEIFKTPHIRGLAEHIKKAVQNKYQSIEPVEKKEYYSLSSAQKRLYILQQMEMESTAYNMPEVISLHEKPDIVKLEHTFKTLIHRHESLRTSFHMISDKPVQRIHDHVKFEIEYYDSSVIGHQSLVNGEGEPLPFKEQLAVSIMENFAHPFDLGKTPLFRVGLLRTEENTILLLDIHHIISDGISHEVLREEFQTIYDGEELPGLRLQYKDYAEWQNSPGQQEKIRKEEEYWLNEFSGELPVLNLLTDYTRPIMQSFKGNTVSFALSITETEIIKNIAKETNATLYMAILSIYNILLSRLSGQEYIIIGTPIAARRHEDLQGIIGMFVNTLPMRNFPQGDKTFKEFLDEVKIRTLEAFENQEYQFEEMVDKLAVKRDLSRNPVFDVMFNLLNQAEYKGERLEYNENEEYVYKRGISKFDMTLSGIDLGKYLYFTFEYCTKLFKASTIERFIKHFRKIISMLGVNIEQKISDIEIISNKEKEQLLYDFNNTKTGYPKDKMIHELFEEQVEKKPDNTAVHGCMIACMHGEDVSITYKELNQKSNQLAFLLAKKGVKPGAITAIMVEPSIEMVLGIMAILKAGGAYMPIDPAYPQQRITYILEDSGTKALVTARDMSIEGKKLENWDGNNIFLEEPPVPPVSSAANSTLHLSPAPVTCLAYVIYTSGSTGNPKGVVVEHPSVVNLLKAMDNYYPLEEPDAYLLKTSYMFDVSVTELFGWFPGGGRLAVMEKGGEKNPEMILDTIAAQRVTHINFVPSMFNVFVNLLNQNNIRKLSGLKYLFLAGEAIVPESVIEFRRLNSTASASTVSTIQVENLYGPTEAAVYASKYSLSCWDKTNNIPIGNPIQNVKLYVINRYNKLHAIGISGELGISGVGLARGYLNNPGLTNNSFIDNPFTPGERMYKTGDLARWLPDGNMEFLGRIDHQVKIRGFRIELGEIETQLLNHDEIKEAVVMAKEDENGDRYLCAYIVTIPKKAQIDETSIDISEIKNFLSENLPGYMLPSYFVVLDKIPLTSNGKVDRKSLPEPEIAAGEDYITPRNDIERKLAAIWSETLNVNKEVIGIHSNFFDLGGHSLKAIILISKIHKELNVKVPLAEIFKTPAIIGLSEYIKTLEENKYEAVKPVEKKEYYELSSAQKRLYILQQIDPKSTACNIPNSIYLGKDTDIQRLGRTFKLIIQRHESFRTSFEIVNEQPVQRIHDHVEFEIKRLEAAADKSNHTPHASIIKKFVRPFDLSQAPLLRGELLKTGEGENLLLVDMNHIISDGVSQQILKEEFMKIYNGEALPGLRLQYKDFAGWQNTSKQQQRIKNQESYWLKVLSDELPVLNLPTDYPRPAMQSFEGNTINFMLDEKKTKIIKNIAKETGATLYMFLLSIYNILLSKLSGQEDIIVGIPIAARRHWDIEKIIGMFVNILAMRNFSQGEKTFNQFLIEVKERTLEAYENQEYQFEDLVDKLSLRRDTSRNPILDVVFNLMNQDNTRKDFSSVGEMDGDEETGNVNKNESSKFDLILNVRVDEKRIYCSFIYCTRLFKESTIRRIIGYFKQIINCISTNRDTKIADIEIIPENKKRDKLNHFNENLNETVDIDPIQVKLHNSFREYNKNIALEYGDTQVTYGELERRAVSISRWILENKIEKGRAIGIYTDDKVDIISAMIGILDAGCVFVPLDTKLPVKRIENMLRTANVHIILTDPVNQNHLTQVRDNNPNIESIVVAAVILEQPGELSLSRLKRKFRQIPYHGEDRVYIYFTSGTTGRPNAIVGKNQGLAQFIQWEIDTFSIDETHRFSQLAAVGFDAFLRNVWTPLCAGATVCIPGDRDLVTDSKRLVEWIDENHITLIHCVPTVFRLINSETLTNKRFSHLKYVLLSGEHINPNDLKPWFQMYGNRVQLVNCYGATETTVIKTFHFILESDPRKNRVPVGVPMRGARAIILDHNRNICDQGIVGEIYIRTPYGTSGYLDDPVLNAERFVRNPIHPDETDIIYRTGDLGRELENGEIEILGRVDKQVKIRGIRIEVEEIKSQLLTHQDVEDAVVIAREKIGREVYLFAYFVSKRKLSGSSLREHLSKELPDYMIPSYFIQLDAIPLTVNGKVNENALPEPGTKKVIDYLLPLLKDAYFNGEIVVEGMDIDVLPVEKKKQLFLGTADIKRSEFLNLKVLSGENTLQKLFEKQVEETPDHIAVVYGNQKVTYRQLNKKANQMAQVLRIKGIQSGAVVGVLMKSSIDMIAAIISILKTGSIYVSLTPGMPQKQVVSILDRCSASLVLTDTGIAEKYSYTNLQGLNKNGESPLFTGSPPAISNLDSLPLPDRSLVVDYEKYHRFIGQSPFKNSMSLVTGRGCPFNCAYCHKVWPKTHASRSAEDIFSEIEMYYDMGVRRFAMLDDIFNLNTKNSMRLFEMIIKNNLKLYLSFNVRSDLLTREFIHLMVRAGATRVAMALETASPRLQRLIRKNLNIEKLQGHLEYITKNYPNVVLELYTMHGFPTETKEEALMTLDFIKSIKWLHFPYVNILRIYQNTHMEKLALQHGISKEAILASSDLAFHELPETLPFDKTFTLNYQAEFLNDYFLNKERLLYVLPYQMKALTEDEIVQKYRSYIAVDISGLNDFLKIAGISPGELGDAECLDETHVYVPNINEKLKTHFAKNKPEIKTPGHEPLRILLLDLSQYFSDPKSQMLYDVVEAPMGLMYVMTYLNEKLGDRVTGKIAKSGIDFNGYYELKTLLSQYKPDVVGIRTLTFYRDFLHRSAAVIKQYCPDVPIILGGPYSTSDYKTILRDRNVDLAVVGEGEITFCTLVEKILENSGKLPDEDTLHEIKGIAFMPKRIPADNLARKIILTDILREVMPETGEIHPNPVYSPGNAANISLIPIPQSGDKDNDSYQLSRLDHRHINYLLDTICNNYSKKNNAHLVTSCLFKPEVHQLFGALLHGASIYIVPEPFKIKGVELLEIYKNTTTGISKEQAVYIRMLSEKPNVQLAEVNHYVSPENEIEEKILQICSDVLNFEQDIIRVDSDLFELGLHSLKATILTNKLHKELNVKVPLAEIFKNPTIRGLSGYIKGVEEQSYSSIKPVEKKEYYPLSSAQKRLFILQQMEPESINYNAPHQVTLGESIDAEKLEKTFKKIISRHESLRTSLHIINEQPIQKIHEELDFSIKINKSGQGIKDIIENFVKPFDLSKAPLLRVELVESGEKEHILIFDMHHVITDGTSQDLLTREFLSLYSGEELSLLPLQYKDFSQWQNSTKQQQLIKQQESYWVKIFSDELPVLNLPTDYARPVIQSFEGNTLNLRLNKTETGIIKNIAKETGATVYMVLLSIYNILLSKLTGQEDIIMGTPIAARRHTDLQRIIGMFVNTLAMRNYPQGDKTFIEFLNEVKRKTLEAIENQEYQFEDLVDKLSVARDISRNPIFDVMFNFGNQEDYSSESIDYNEKTAYVHKRGTSKFDMTFIGIDLGESLYFTFEYCTKLFKPETIERFIKYFRRIISVLGVNIKQEISGMEVISEQERNQLLYDFNNTKTGYPAGKTIHELFEEQAKRVPDHTALVGMINPKSEIRNRASNKQIQMTEIQTSKQEGTRGLAPLYITYRELNHKSNQLALLLAKKGVKPGTIAGIMVEPSIEMVLGIMAVLKAGGTYMPIDPDYPADRINYMLADSEAKLLVTTRIFAEEDRKPGTWENKKIFLEDFFDKTSVAKKPYLHLSPAPATCLAYVIYTSGSTGKPKGVVVEHQSVINLLAAMADYYPLRESDVYLLKTSYMFDVSVTELFGWFPGGGRLAIMSKGGEKDPQMILDIIAAQQVTHINFVPSMFQVFVHLLHHGSPDNIKKLSPLKYLFLAGEAIVPESVTGFRELNGTVQLENLYGPTEAAVYASKFSLADWDANCNIPIGKPIDNVKLYIVDKHSRLQGIGVAGELCIAGVGLARGYLNNPALTHGHFVDNPAVPGKRMYKTGDLARWLPDGNIEFLGRIDHQVKIRGFRIESGEIESRLLSRDEIKEAIVLAKKDKNEDKYLCAYIVAEGELSVSELRGYLSKELQAYMVPSFFVCLKKLPLTPNGKVDRKALPEPDNEGTGEVEAYVSPRNEPEEKLVELWSEVLPVEKDKIGIDYNFFKLGGNSLKAILLTSKIHREFSVKVPLVELFKIPTIRELGAYINGTVQDKYRPIKPTEKKDYYPLSSAQKRLYVQQQMEPGSTVYNLPQIMGVEGGLEKEKLEDTFRKLISRHEIFRTSFNVINREPLQKIHEPGAVNFTLMHYAADEEEAQRIVKRFVRPFDLGKAPLIRVGLIEKENGKSILMMDIHHIITDGISQGIFVNDFIRLYKEEELPPLKLQYKDFSQWKNSGEEVETMKKQEENWMKQFEGEIPLLKLRTDYERPAIKSFEGNMLSFEIGPEDTKAIKEWALEEDITLFMLLLAAYNVLLAKITGQEDIVVGTGAMGRGHPDLESIIGMFVNMLALRNYPKGAKHFRDFLKDVKKSTLNAFENQDYQFEDLVEQVLETREAGRSPLFDVVFSMQNLEPSAAEVPNLKLKPFRYEKQISKFDITMVAVEAGDKLHFNIEYSTEIFKQETIERFIGYFKEIVSAVLEDRNTKLSDVRISHDYEDSDSNPFQVDFEFLEMGFIN